MSGVSHMCDCMLYHDGGEGPFLADTSYTHHTHENWPAQSTFHCYLPKGALNNDLFLFPCLIKEETEVPTTKLWDTNEIKVNQWFGLFNSLTSEFLSSNPWTLNQAAEHFMKSVWWTGNNVGIRARIPITHIYYFVLSSWKSHLT